MSNTRILGLALAALLLPASGIADSDEDYTKECKEYAVEEKVSTEEMESFIEECVNDMKQAASENQKGSDKD